MHFLADALAGTNKQRVDKGIGSKTGLAHQTAQLLALAQAAKACDRKGHGAILAARDAGSPLKAADNCRRLTLDRHAWSLLRLLRY
jgi:hypothetical protein